MFLTLKSHFKMFSYDFIDTYFPSVNYPNSYFPSLIFPACVMLLIIDLVSRGCIHKPNLSWSCAPSFYFLHFKLLFCQRPVFSMGIQGTKIDRKKNEGLTNMAHKWYTIWVLYFLWVGHSFFFFRQFFFCICRFFSLFSLAKMWIGRVRRS